MLRSARFHLLIIAFLVLSLRSSRLRGEIRWALPNVFPGIFPGHIPGAQLAFPAMNRDNGQQ
jgi:hypothetical protein